MHAFALILCTLTPSRSPFQSFHCVTSEGKVYADGYQAAARDNRSREWLCRCIYAEDSHIMARFGRSSSSSLVNSARGPVSVITTGHKHKRVVICFGKPVLRPVLYDIQPCGNEYSVKVPPPKQFEFSINFLDKAVNFSLIQMRHHIGMANEWYAYYCAPICLKYLPNRIDVWR